MEKTLRLELSLLQSGVGPGGGAPGLTAAVAVVVPYPAKARTGKATMATAVPKVGLTPVAVVAVPVVLRGIPPKQAARCTHRPTVGSARSRPSRAPQCGTPVAAAVVCRRITVVPERGEAVAKVVAAKVVGTHQTVRPVQQTLGVAVVPAVRIEANR